MAENGDNEDGGIEQNLRFLCAYLLQKGINSAMHF